MQRLALFCIACALCALACTPASTGNEAIDVPAYDIETFLSTEAVGGGYFSPDEQKLLIHSNRSGIYNVYAVPVTGGQAVQLTRSDSSSIFAIGYLPTDERFLFSMDNGGNEISHIYLQDTTGTVTDLTPQPNGKANFAGWAHDNSAFYYLSNARNPQFFDLYKVPLATMKAQLLYQNNEPMFVGAMSDDERYIALVKSNTTSDSDLYLHDRQSGTTTHISQHEGTASFSPEFFSRDNTALFYTTDEGGEFSYLMSYNLATGEKQKVYEGDWDVSYASISHNATYRLVALNEDAKTTILLTNAETGEAVEMPDVGQAEITSVNISRSEQAIRLSVSSSTSPNDIYYYNMESGQLTKLTSTLNEAINAEHLVEAQVVRYPSFDGTQIPAILYKPHQASAQNKVPALVWVHGGPGGQSRVGFSSVIQYLVNHGYAIIAVNNRGSSGYGKTFYQMDDKQHGEGDLQDCIAAKDYLAGLGYIDTEKIGIMGGSYGGFMVMAALTSTPDEFEVGVNLFGVTNWLRTLQSIPAWWGASRTALFNELGDPFTEDSVRLRRISPLFNASKINKPVMVLQGANDPRVLQVESDEIVEQARANGVPVEYVLFDDEGHGFVKKENQIEGYSKVLQFLDQYLKGEASQTPEASETEPVTEP